MGDVIDFEEYRKRRAREESAAHDGKPGRSSRGRRRERKAPLPEPVVRDEDDEIIESFDMQWIAPFGGATDDLVFIAIHSPDQVQDVCDTFPF